jgi:hypothetical protein
MTAMVARMMIIGSMPPSLSWACPLASAMFSAIATIIIPPRDRRDDVDDDHQHPRGASRAAGGREHGGAAKKNSIFWAPRSFGSCSLTAIPCRMHRISFDLRS